MRIWSRLRGRGRHAGPPAPFIVGVARSGTTLLRLMLDAHPEMAIPPETHFIPKVIKACDRADDPHEAVFELLTAHRRWPDYGLDANQLRERLDRIAPLSAGDALRAFYGLYAEKQGKPRWGDKSPSYVRRMRRVASALPEAHFVHLVRDGRDVALSQVEVDFGPDQIADAARDWVEGIEKAHRQARRLRHYIEVRYEDLVTDPEPPLRLVCEFVRLRWDPAMLAYHAGAEERMAEVTRDFERGEGPAIPATVRASRHTRVAEPPQRERAGRWRTDMSPSDRATFEGIAGEQLAKLGYKVSGSR
ncbi:MAG TPA: sulfotransferase [Solirubrobacterales bacterium]|nr:sulfotransferase [Solirubrobacterales bacterium]